MVVPISSGQTVARDWPGNTSVRAVTTTSTALVLVITALNVTVAPGAVAVSLSVNVPSPLASLVLSMASVIVEVTVGVTGTIGSTRVTATVWASATVTFWGATVEKPAGVIVSTSQYVPEMTGVSEQLPAASVLHGAGGFTTTPGPVPVSV